MHVLAAQGSEQKRKACINFTQLNLFSKWYCNGNTLPHKGNWNLWTSYVIILVQCNFVMMFKSIVIPVHYHNKFPKFVCNVIDLCTTQGQIIKIVWRFPLKLICKCLIMLSTKQKLMNFVFTQILVFPDPVSAAAAASSARNVPKRSGNCAL